jgi:hypothetical protein
MHRGLNECIGLNEIHRISQNISTVGKAGAWRVARGAWSVVDIIIS